MKPHPVHREDAIRAVLSVGIIATAVTVVADRSLTAAILLIGVAVAAMATGRIRPRR